MIRNIWQYQAMVSRRLLRWAGISILAGLIMKRGTPFWRNMGFQFITWGAINALIAWGGEIVTRDRVAKMPNPGEYPIRQKENHNLKRLLWINAGLDVLYILFGKRMTNTDKGDCTRKGAGWGIILQGAFLFFFDVFHALNMPEEEDQ